MRKASLLLVPATLLALVAGPLSVASSAAPPKRAELVAKRPTASYANGKLTVEVQVKNKGTKKAKKSQTWFFLSTDPQQSANDAKLGALTTPRLKPKKKKTISGAFVLPTGLKPGVYRLIACADATGVVRERKEQNNCKASRTSITLQAGPPPPGKVTITWTVAPVQASLVGSVSGSATNGSCATDALTGGGSCLVSAGVGTVTLTATPLLPLFIFQSWSGTSCTGTTNPLVITNPQTNIACTATFEIPLPI